MCTGGDWEEEEDSWRRIVKQKESLEFVLTGGILLQVLDLSTMYSGLHTRCRARQRSCVLPNEILTAAGNFQLTEFLILAALWSWKIQK